MEVLFRIIIEPIKCILDIVFSTAYCATNNIIFSLITLSVFVTIITLPIYNRAEYYRNEELRKRKDVEVWADRIKKSFRGKEQRYILAAFYKEKGYTPYHGLGASLSLLIQIPFFIAAYKYLSEIGEKGLVSKEHLVFFLNADKMLSIGSIDINVLPIVMTLISVISGVIYTEGLRFRDKLQVFILPVVFLLLLYNCPFAIVLYWTMNNFLSLAKNIIAKMPLKKNKIIGKIVGPVVLIGWFAFLVWINYFYNYDSVKMDESIGVFIFSLVIIALSVAPIFIITIVKMNSGKSLNKEDYECLFISELICVLFFAFYIPITIISSSPEEMLTFGIGMGEVLSYGSYVYVGSFLIWVNVFAFLLPSNIRCIISECIMAFAFCSVFQFFLLGYSFGIVTDMVTFESAPNFSGVFYLTNTVLSVVTAVLLLVLIKKYKSIINAFGFVMLVSLFIIGVVNYSKTNVSNQSMETVTNKKEGIFQLSKNEKNVVIIMLDRAIGAYVPFIMQDKPELVEKFDGFVYYPNSTSMGGYTVFGSAEVFGGYEYTPYEMNKRDKELMVDKQNEALKVLPKLFSDSGYNVTVADLPYANYKVNFDTSIYNGFEGVEAYDLASSKTFYLESDIDDLRLIKTVNISKYAFIKSLPAVFQLLFYDDGMYRTMLTRNASTGKTDTTYRVLESLNDLTEIEDEKKGNLIMFANRLTHNPIMTQLPDYSMCSEVDNSQYDIYEDHYVDDKRMKMDTLDKVKNYHCNVLAYSELGKWFDYMRENDVYDNTRIIITSDHGRKIEQFDDLLINDELNVELFNCPMLVKDFNAKGFSISDEFMTNADTPTLATDGILDSPTNPYTGKMLNSFRKNQKPLEVTLSEDRTLPKGNLQNTFEAPWYTIHDNIRNKEYWEKCIQN